MVSLPPGSPTKVSSGLVHLTRLHCAKKHDHDHESNSQSSSRSSLLSSNLFYSQNEQQECDETDTPYAILTRSSYLSTSSNWSWKHLKRKFDSKDAEILFDKYQVRLKHSFFLVLLLMNILFNVVGVIVFFFDEHRESFPGPVIIRCTSILVFICFLILVCMDEEWLQPKFSRVVASFTVLVAMVFAEYGTCLYMFFDVKLQQPNYQTVDPDSEVIGFIPREEDDENDLSSHVYLQRIRPTFCIIFMNQVFLPFPSRLYGFLSNLIIISLEVWLIVKTRCLTGCPSHVLTRYATADAIFYLVSAMISFVVTVLAEIANTRAFIDHRKCVMSKFRLQFEHEQQDSLLKSCLPTHLAERVKDDLRTVQLKTRSKKSRPKALSLILPPPPAPVTPMRSFNELYMEKYTDVSILYADIVNSMLLAGKLTPNELIETLNDLFGRFDEAAEKYNCLRIKLLGDCYYCVSGVPDHDENHVMNTIDQGLEMIKIIQSVADERDVDVNMRIGIHSGMVLSGILGLHKWQYDIWSKDCMKASHLEHTGVPGRVHVSSETYQLIPPTALSQLLVRGLLERLEQKPDDELTSKVFFVPARTSEDGSTTYLITRKPVSVYGLSVPSLSEFSPNITHSPCSRRNLHMEKLKSSIGKMRRRSSVDSFVSKRQVPLFSPTRIQDREMNGMVNEQMEKDIESMPLSKKTQWFSPRGIHPFWLCFTSDFLRPEGHHDAISQFRHRHNNANIWYFESKFARQSDSLFRLYLYSSCLIELAIITIKLTTPRLLEADKLKWALGGSTITVVISLAVTYITPRRLTFISRMILWLVISTCLLLCASVDIITEDCYGTLNVNKEEKLTKCAFSWFNTFGFILAMTSASLFLRVNLWFKLLAHVISILIFVFLNNDPCSVLSILDSQLSWTFLGYSPHLSHLYYVVTSAFMLHMIDRQIEYILRLDFQWTTKLEAEKSEASIVQCTNDILLENILPIHVAQKFLSSSSSSFSENVYFESYEGICVMFASIPNYIEFYNESKINEDGLKCLLLLNEIICDFDQLLDDKQFKRVEKIKTTGSTYMAAAGLLPGRGSIDSLVYNSRETCSNVMSLVKYSLALMDTIEALNRDALQSFKLRIGMSVGPVVAGVVGSSKPQYDIWGDTVNVASRMESTGILGRIQVTDLVANVVMTDTTTRIGCECRGPIQVKGKGEVITYLISCPSDLNETTSF